MIGARAKCGPRVAAALIALAPTALALIALPIWPARAELLAVRQIAGGMECPECARGLLLQVKAIPGVDNAERAQRQVGTSAK